jgi:hypothetical protein
MRCLRDTIRYAHYDHFGFDAVFSLRGSLCSTTSVSMLFSAFAGRFAPPLRFRQCSRPSWLHFVPTTSVSTMFATFVATLRSDHFGFDAINDTQVSFMTRLTSQGFLGFCRVWNCSSTIPNIF